MYRIVKKENPADRIIFMEVEAERLSKKGLPGQFIIAKKDETGERIPLTIADTDAERKTVSIVFQIVGASTAEMAEMEEGDSFMDFAGPLGNPSELVLADPEELKKMKLLFVAGGVGIAPVYPQVKWLHEHGVSCDVIMGARTESLLFFEDRMKEAGNVYICTDDGSKGFHGNTCDMINELIARGNTYDRVIAIGPCIMMKFVCQLTKKLNIPTIVSMNPIMVDGTGMCGACRLQVGDEVKFACVDGPEFDGHLIDFDEVMKRQQIYRTEEGRAYLRFQEGKTHHGSCGRCD